MSSVQRDKRYLQAAKRIFAHIAETADLRFCIRLWDDTIIPLGDQADPRHFISIRGPGVLGSILRQPTLENALRQYATGGIDYHGCDLFSFYEIMRTRGDRSRTASSRQLKKRIRKGLLLRAGLPFLFAPAEQEDIYRFAGEATGRNQAKRNNREFIQFHYDLSNAFYRLFLDPEMQYSCGYFTGWENDLETAQRDKLEMICRKLRLQEGDRLLDIGCGWGGLLCYAASRYKVRGHGVTLSQHQYDFATDKVKQMGLDDRVKIELRDYSSLSGEYDKIASIGMYEHVGIAQYRTYFDKVSSLLCDRGIFLNHGITRRAKHSRRRFARITPERRLILKYIFPGSELDHIGHSIEIMEACGFEIHDVEGWREHYARTTRLWCQRLEKNSEQALTLVGSQKFRMWIAYLAGVSMAFHDGSLRIFQTVATKHHRKGGSTMPPTRQDLYR